MLTGDKKGRVPHDLLLQNTVALVRLQHKGDEKYEIRQEYLAVKDGDMEVVGRTII